MGHGYNRGIFWKVSILSISGVLIVNDEDEIDFETLDIENSNDNDESEINEKDEEAATVDDPITSETKKVRVVIID